MFEDLLKTPGVAEIYRPGSPVGVMALHGGLEEGTYEIARDAAEATGASLYAVVLPDDLRWHVPSTRFDPRSSDRLRRFLTRVRLAVSVHGYGRHGVAGTVLVGGRSTRLGEVIAAALEREVEAAIVTDPNAMPRGLKGTHPRNPVNLPELGGAQLELTPDLRRPPASAAVTSAMISAIEGELRSVCAAG